MNTNFAVSNTDVVTMLMVKQKERLITRKNEIIVELAEMDANFLKKISAQYKKRLEDFDPKIVEAYTQLVKACNPKLKFSVRVGITNIDMHYLRYKRDRNTHRITHVVLEEDYVELDASVAEKDEDKFVMFSGDGIVQIPFKIKIEVVCPKNYEDLEQERIKIDQLLKDESALRDKIVASVTAQAISNIPELKSIAEGSINDLLALPM